MKPNTNSLKLISISFLKDRTYLLMLASILSPAIVLIGFGVHSVLRHNYLITFLITSAGITALITFFLIITYRIKHAKLKNKIEYKSFDFSPPPPPGHWTPRDQEVREEILPLLIQILNRPTPWINFHEEIFKLGQNVSKKYNPNYSDAEWAFSPTELLILTEHLSRRYRVVLKEHIPYIEKLQIRNFFWAKKKYEQSQPFLKFYQVYRKVRIITPNGMLAEIRSIFTDIVIDKLTDRAQKNIKYLLLVESLHTAIDLYAGHFKFTDDELETSNAYKSDSSRIAKEPEPVRICLIGQINAGKSSVINSILSNTKAEVGPLPTTNRALAYSLKLGERTVINILDLPGLDGNPETENLLLKEVKQCDIVLWVLRVDQPGRAPDHVFITKIRDWFSKEINRKPPLIIGLLNHIDRLDRSNNLNEKFQIDSDTPYAKKIRQAIDYNRELLEMDEIIPICLVPDKPKFNVDKLLAVVQKNYEDAINIQLNRRRLEQDEFSISDIFDCANKARNISTSLFKTLRQS